jgi:two-component system, NarL family, sensor histidine kinase UhpB
MQEQGQISFDVKIDDSFLSAAARQNLLLIVKECLTNIQKHSAASSVQIHLASKFGKAELIVSDNGHGFPTGERAEGLGIKGMNERVSSLGGTFNIKSDPGKGTRILVSLPP